MAKMGGMGRGAGFAGLWAWTATKRLERP